jgi:hypothetical protein
MGILGILSSRSQLSLRGIRALIFRANQGGFSWLSYLPERCIAANWACGAGFYTVLLELEFISSS